MCNLSQYTIVLIDAPTTSRYVDGLHAVRLDRSDNFFAIPTDDLPRLENRTTNEAMPVALKVLPFSRGLEVMNEKADELCRCLRERLQQRPRPSHQKETRFFLRYDALVDAALLFYIQQGQVTCKEVLNFLDPRPALNGFLPTDIQDFPDILQKRVNERQAHGSASELSDPEMVMVDKLAQYQYQIFQRSYPTSDNRVSSAMVHAFTLFCGGVIASADPRLHYNTCPDSSPYFFCFAEFAIHASKRDRKPEQIRYWESFLRMIVPLGQVYHRRYHLNNPMRASEIHTLLEQHSHYSREGLIRSHTAIVRPAANYLGQ